MSLPSRLLGANPSIQVSTLLSGSLSTPSAKQVFVPPTPFQSITSATPSGTDTVTFSSIPQTYKILQIRVSLVTSSAVSLLLRYNGDSSSVYSCSSAEGNGTSTTGGQDHSASRIAIAFNNYGSSSSSTFPASAIINLANYATAGTYKTAISYYGVNQNTTGKSGIGQGVWFDTSAITSMTFFLTGTNFLSGTSISLYGIEG